MAPSTASIAWANLVAYWKLDESSWSGTSNDVLDSKGTDHARGYGSIAPAAGLLNNGASVNGGTLKYIGNFLTYVHPDNDFTVTAWLKAADITNTFGVLVLGNLEIYNYYNFPVTPNTFYVKLFNGVSQIYVLSTAAAAYLGAAYHLHVVTWKNSTSTLTYYIDDGLIGSTSSTSGGSVTFNRYLGRSSTSSRCPSGILDDVEVFNRVLTADEMTAYYNSGSGVINIPIPAYSTINKSNAEIDDTCVVKIIGTDLDLVTGITWNSVALSYTLVGTTAIYITAKQLSNGVNPFVLAYTGGTTNTDNFTISTSEFAVRSPTISQAMRYGKFTGEVTKKMKFIKK